MAQAKSEIEQIKDRVIDMYPSFGAKIFNVKMSANTEISTAGTNGEEIIYNPDFFDKLTDDEKDFVFAHEACHIVFKHVPRGKEKKYPQLWNIATDACVNAFLKKDGLMPPKPQPVLDDNGNQVMDEDGKPVMTKEVDIADGLYRDAETIYEKLVEKQKKQQEEKEKQQQEEGQQQGEGQGQQEKKQQSKQKGQGQQDKQKGQNGEEQEQDSGEVGGGLDDIDFDSYKGFDDHKIWDEPEKEQKKEERQKTKISGGSKSMQNKISQFNGKPKDKILDGAPELKQEFEEKSEPINEAREFKKNEIKRDEQIKERAKVAVSNIFETAGIANPTYVKPVLSWKRLLVKAVEEQQEMWVYRRSSRFNPNVRIGDVMVEGRATTEVILDTSGSIEDSLLRGFLRQLVPMFKETDIKVGCFGGSFHGFNDLTTKKQVEEFKATRDGDGTNFEAAATAFTKNPRRRTNKIVFTDGQLDGNYHHKQTTRADGVMWLVFGGKSDFSPIGGKTIKINSAELEKMKFETQIETNDREM